MEDDINVSINNLYLFIPNLVPSVGSQLMFNGATQSNYNISYDEHHTKRRLISDMIFQVDIGSAEEVSSPKYSNCAHQTQLGKYVPNKNNNIAIFVNLDLRKYYVEIDSVRCPCDSVHTNYEEINCITQYKDLKL